MRLHRVNSRSMTWMGYEAQKRHLYIVYPSGDLYCYLDVPPEENAEFEAAESKGIYLNHVFKPKGYRFEIIRRGHTWPKAS